MSPIIEAYIGEYASGKSEVAVNRAIQLVRQNREVTIADLDIVEPCYTLRPLIKKLEEMGINVVAWETSETVGLGEAGSIIKPQLRWVLRRPGDIILDIGYGVEGAKTLNIVEGAADNPDLKIYLVINTGRPMTMNQQDIIEYIGELGTIDGLINNSHLGDETNVEFIQEGAKIVTAVSKIVNIPVIATTAERKLAEAIGKVDVEGNQVWAIDRYMPQAFW